MVAIVCSIQLGVLLVGPRPSTSTKWLPSGGAAIWNSASLFVPSTSRPTLLLQPVPPFSKEPSCTRLPAPSASSGASSTAVICSTSVSGVASSAPPLSRTWKVKAVDRLPTSPVGSQVSRPRSAAVIAWPAATFCPSNISTPLPGSVVIVTDCSASPSGSL